MAKFCGKCGSRLDEATGLCPNCDAEKIKQSVEKPAEPPKEIEKKPETSQPQAAPISKKEARAKRKADKKAVKKERKAQKKAAKKAKKREKWVAKPWWKKTLSILLRCIAWLLVLVFAAMIVILGLVHFQIIDIPVIARILSRSGLEASIEVAPDPAKDNYIPNEESIKFDSDTNVYYADNELVIIFSPSATDEQIVQAIDSIQGKIVGTIPTLNMYQVIISGSHTRNDLLSISQDLMDCYDYISYATYDSAIVCPEDASATPNDPWNKDVNQQDWTDTDIDGSNWWIEAIEAQDVWAYADDYPTINIGISDSSFDIGHEDLKNISSFPNDILESRNIVAPWWDDDNSETWSVSGQTNYHGTHVAGIIGAEQNNKKGITGIVPNCHMYLAPYYCDDQAPAYLWWDTSTYANLTYLVEAGAKIINYSQGKTNFLTSTNSSYDNTFLEREGHLAAISMAMLLQEGYDFIVVQSAGNGTGDNSTAVDALQNGWFASVTSSSVTGSDSILINDVLDRIVIVGAAEQNGSGYRCTSFSNFGSQVDIFAPGRNIYSTVPGEVFWGFEFWGGYAEASGTSMSAPIVTGVCALAWSSNTELTGAEVKEIVCSNTKDVVITHPDTPDNSTYNLVNAKLAVEAARHYVQTDTPGTYDPSDIPDDAVAFNGHYYKVFDLDGIQSYQSASSYCINLNGYLATITSKEENDFLYDYITKSGFSGAYFGYSDEVSEGVWKWSNGEISAYTNWHSGEPNSENSNEDYGQFYYKFTDGTWNDGDFDEFVFICEWGEYSVSQPNDEPIRTTSDERDIVLVLDVSGSMSGTPMAETKKASVNFIDTILDEDASIGIVTYDNSASMLSDFSVNETALTTAVSSIYDGGGTNIESGLAQARSMLNTSNAKKKIIVLMSDGEPNDGKEGDDLIAYADDIKEGGIIIYTLGFFESMGSYKSSAQLLMEGIASDGCHYEVASADDLVFFFEDVADQINGQKYIYIRIACPVDVTVTHKGETLCSAEDDLNTRTDFGTLTFEDNENVTNADEDDRIKVLRLKEGADYDIQINGTGHGLMDYTIGFMDENGDYSDFRRFENVKITRRTTIDTVAAVSKTSVLNIDENGDGKYDLKLRAEENGYGEEVDDSLVIYAAVGGGTFLFLVIVILIAQNNRKKRKVKENQ